MEQVIKSSKKTGTTPCQVWEGHTIKVLELPSSSFRVQTVTSTSRASRSLDVWIELDDKLTQVVSAKHLFKWVFIRELPSFDRKKNTSQTQELLGNIEHTTPRSHTNHSRPPESSAGVIHIKKHTYRSYPINMKSTRHTSFKSEYKHYKDSSQHSTTFPDSCILYLKRRKERGWTCQKKKEREKEILIIKECPC